MTSKNLFLLLSAGLFIVFSPVALAKEETVHEIVEQSTKLIIAAVNEGRDSFESDPDKLIFEVLRLTDGVVAYDAISRSVMGKYKKQATDEQKENFTKVFKGVMIKLYVKALILFESEKITVIPPEEDKKITSKAKVMMDVSGNDGRVYKVIYSMRKNSQGKWQARNMIVDGINLGLTYLNQFDSAMNRHDQDMDKVIASWQQEMTE